MDTIPREAGAQLMDCAMDLDSRQKFLPDSAPWAAKAKQNSVVSSHCPRVCYKITFEIHFIIKLQIIALFKKFLMDLCLVLFLRFWKTTGAKALPSHVQDVLLENL